MVGEHDDLLDEDSSLGFGRHLPGLLDVELSENTSHLLEAKRELISAGILRLPPGIT